MIDNVEPIDVPCCPTQQCPSCQLVFEPSRSNQKYCSRSCQKNGARGTRTVESKDRSHSHYDRAARLAEMVYSAPPQERLGVMRHILSYVPTDSGLRNILTDPELHCEPPTVCGRMNIAKAANAYTKRFFGISIRTFVSKLRKGEEAKGVPLSR